MLYLDFKTLCWWFQNIMLMISKHYVECNLDGWIDCLHQAFQNNHFWSVKNFGSVTSPAGWRRAAADVNRQGVRPPFENESRSRRWRDSTRWELDWSHQSRDSRNRWRDWLSCKSCQLRYLTSPSEGSAGPQTHLKRKKGSEQTKWPKIIFNSSTFEATVHKINIFQ